MSIIKKLQSKKIAVTKRDLILRKLKTQFDLSCGINRLCFAVVEQAIHDVFNDGISESDRASAKQYLNGNIIHAESCGVDSKWIRLVIKMVDAQEYKTKVVGKTRSGKPIFEVLLAKPVAV